MNFPADDPLYQGNQWNEPRQNEALAEADVVLVIDSDVPWIPVVSRPRADAAIFHIDVDPLKQAMPLWYIGARQVWRAEAAIGTASAQRASGRRRDRRPRRRVTAHSLVGTPRGARGTAARARSSRTATSSPARC